MITFVHEYIGDQIITSSPRAVANKLQISAAMVSKYKNASYGFKPSIDVAKLAYIKDRVVLHPFSEESLKYEINRGE